MALQRSLNLALKHAACCIAGVKVLKDLFQVDYNFGLIFVVLDNIPVFILAKVFAEIWEHVEWAVPLDIFPRSWWRPNQETKGE